MSVTDPIFDSLWDATLWELAAEPGIWEPFWDSANFFAGASDDIRAVETERVLRRLRDEGWALFVRRPWEQLERDIGEVMPASAIEAAIAGRLWQQLAPLPDDCNIWLVPTDKWWRWRQQEDGSVPPDISDRRRRPSR